MSLETLLEAAEYLEWKQSSTRVDKNTDFHRYAKASNNQADSGGSDGGEKSGYSLSDDGKDKRRAGGAGTREVHNKLEKNRRAHLKECFELLKSQLPNMDKKTSNLSILRGSLRYIQVLKRKEKEFEQEMQKLAREKIKAQERIAALKRDLALMNIEVDLNHWIQSQEEETNSTSTATETGSVVISDDEDDTPRTTTATVMTGSGQTINIITQIPKSPPITSPSNAQGKPGPQVPTPVTPNNKTSVTQILHQTITQRAALQQQQQAKNNMRQFKERVVQLQQQNPAVRPQTVQKIVTVTVPSTSSPSAANTVLSSTLRAPPLRPSLANNVRSFDKLELEPYLPYKAKIPHVSVLRNVVATKPSSTGLNLITTKQVILTTLAPTRPTLTTSSPASSVVTVSTVNTVVTQSSAQTSLSTATGKVNTNHQVTANQVTSLSGSSGPVPVNVVKNVFAPAGIAMNAQMITAAPQIVNQANQLSALTALSQAIAARTTGPSLPIMTGLTTVPVTQVAMTTASNVNQAGTTSSSTSAGVAIPVGTPTISPLSSIHSIGSLAQMSQGMAPTVIPVTVMSPAIQLSQTQIGGVLNPLAFKTGLNQVNHIPAIIHQPLTQVPVVKPVLIATNVTTQSPQVTKAAVTQTTSS